MICPSCFEDKDPFDFIPATHGFEICPHCWSLEFGPATREDEWRRKWMASQPKGFDLNSVIGGEGK